MGQKVHPAGFASASSTTGSRMVDWKAGVLGLPARRRPHPQTHSPEALHAGLSDILIRKDKQRITVDIFTARPGIVIGKRGGGGCAAA